MTTPINELQNPIPDITIEQLSVPLREATSRAGWNSLMPVQARGIPYLLAGRNMMIQARTGSGKTGAFLLPLRERLDASRNVCQALILVPTRELAKQVGDDADILFKTTGLRCATVYGGVGYGPQAQALTNGAQVVVGTPGRVLDHLLKRTFSLEHLKILIFDEADRMLSMGFYPDMLQMRRYLPTRALHTCMFSATFPLSVMRTAREFIREPEFINLSSDHIHVSEVEHVYYIVPGMDKDRSLVRLIEVENPASALIFCNTKVRVNYVAVVLQRFGYDADELSADLSQSQREKVLERVRKGTLRFLVATDVAARGLDLPELSHVIQYEPPEEIENYIHRAGRTGRAGASGTAISLVNSGERFALEKIAKAYEIPMRELPIPSDEDVAAVVAERLTALLEARLRERDKLQTERSHRFEPLARALAEAESELPLITMLLDDTYQQVQHAPVLLPGEEPTAPIQQRQKPANSGGNRRRGGGRRR
ncbi:MAG: DEAD/DEAH box helicase [Anaerolineales bacterium]